MTDNVRINATTVDGGETIRTDDISGVQFPVSKIAIGADGTDDGLVSSANPLPVSVVGATSLPTGAATEATLASVLAALADTIAVSAAALPLPAGAATQATLAQVLSALSGTVAVSTASLPLPAGASTESTLSAISAKLAALGQKAMSGSTPVAIASDQSAVPISAAALPLPSGAATESTLTGVLTTAAFQARIPSSVSGSLPIIGSLGIPAHDYVGISYTGDRVDAYTYKSGGSGGTTVATVTLGYTGDNVTSITKA